MDPPSSYLTPARQPHPTNFSRNLVHHQVSLNLTARAPPRRIRQQVRNVESPAST